MECAGKNQAGEKKDLLYPIMWCCPLGQHLKEKEKQSVEPRHPELVLLSRWQAVTRNSSDWQQASGQLSHTDSGLLGRPLPSLLHLPGLARGLTEGASWHRERGVVSAVASMTVTVMGLLSHQEWHSVNSSTNVLHDTVTD